MQFDKRIYFADVELFKEYMNDFSSYDCGKKIEYSKEKFWHLLFLISKSYLNDNFHKLFNMVNDDLLEKVFTCTLHIGDYFEDAFPIDNNSILELFLSNQHFNVDNNFNDYKKLFKIIRNHLSHYNYEFENNIIKFYSYDYKLHVSFSVATLVLILLASLSNIGQSKKINAFETFMLRLNDDVYEVVVRNKILNNELTPNDVSRNIVKPLLSNTFRGKKESDLEKIEGYLCSILFPNILKETGYEVKINRFDKSIMEIIAKYLGEIEEIEEQEFINLYQMINSSIKMSTISYKYLITILFGFFTNKRDYYKEFSLFIPLMNNELIICLLNIVFCDGVARKYNNVSDYLFQQIKPRKIASIPWKMRNSLNHCHYKFQDITNDDSDVMVEFWDENENVINFECKIKFLICTELVN